jgi:putative endopeptidase
MIPVLRPLLAALALSLAAGGVVAKKKPAAPAAPAACIDFYEHINSPWLLANPVAAGQTSRSRWDELNELAARQAQALAANTVGTAAGTGSAQGLLADLVASATGEAHLESAGNAVLPPLLERIENIGKPKDIAPTLAAFGAQGLPLLLQLNALRDPNSGQPQATLTPNGLGLFDPEFYGSQNPPLQRAVESYRAYVSELLKLSGVPGDKIAERTGWVIAIETDLAEAMRRGSDRTILTRAQADKTYPQLALAHYLQAQGATPTHVVLQYPTYFKAVDRMIGKTPVAHWRAYLRARLLSDLAPTLGKDYWRAYSGLYDVVLRGAAGPKNSSERTSQLLSGDASELFNAAYAERYLAKAEAQKAEAIGAAIRTAMGRAIDRAAWLSAEGKAAARAKLDAMGLAIGTPTAPVSFEGLRFDRSQYAANVLSLRRWRQARDVSLLTRPIWPWPVDQTRPLIGYEPAGNRLIVTAAALQAPVFTGKIDAADYGALGALVAQQMSLAFNRFEGTDDMAWKNRTASVNEQYKTDLPATVAKPDAEKIRAFNIADLAGVELAWDAFETLGTVDTAAKKTFFAVWASLWARNDRELSSATADTAIFAPPKWRVNGPLGNTPGFQQAYGCKAGQAMFKPEQERIAIWR